MQSLTEMISKNFRNGLANRESDAAIFRATFPLSFTNHV